MSFNVTAEAYDQFMGRYSLQLAPLFADFAGVENGQRALDVGCGPGALTSELMRRLGPGQVSACDPSSPFVEAAQLRNPLVDIQVAPAEALPFPDDSFDVSLAQLVVHFMKDPVQGLTEMARVTRPKGLVAACVWDYAGDRGAASTFFRVARIDDPDLDDESTYNGARDGHLVELMTQAGLKDPTQTELTVSFSHERFEDWWQPFTLGVGPAGAYLASQSERRRHEIETQARKLYSDFPLTVSAVVWAAKGTVV